MQDLIIASTYSSPLASFETNGNLILKGRSLAMDVNRFYDPLIEWARKVNTSKVSLMVELDYYNTASGKKILDLLVAFQENENISGFEVIWNYEEDDEDMLEKGQLFAEKLTKTRFIFKELIDA
jgi:hypothetical protein